MVSKIQYKWLDKDANTAACGVSVRATDINNALLKSLPIAIGMKAISDCVLTNITASIKYEIDEQTQTAGSASDCARYIIIVVEKSSGRMGLLYIPSPKLDVFTLPATHPMIAEISDPIIAALEACLIGSLDETGEQITAIVACGLAY
jgi:hypothetical protein